MRKNASVFVTGLIAASIPFGAQAETISADGTAYSYAAEPVYSDAYAPTPSYGYGETAFIQENAVIYAPEGDVYQVIGGAPIAYEDASGASYEAAEAQMMSDQSGNTIMTETIDGIVYETVLSSDVSTINDVQIIQTY